MLVRCGNEPQLADFTILCNTGDGGVFSNVRENLKKGYAKFKEQIANGRTIAICGSGPSLADTLENIKGMQKRGAFILALNGTGKYLTENGIKPDALAMVDPRPDNVDFVEQAWAPEAWFASQCDPSVFEQAEKVGMKITLWHPGVPGIQNNIPSLDSLRMGGGYTIGMCSISLAYVAGFREMHLFGYDSSHREEKGHAFRQDRNLKDEMVGATVDSQKFTCSMTMAAQASLFLEFTKHLLKDGCELYVHGSGLLPTLWESEQKKKRLKVLNAVYDLGVSPPTYDFISFLAEAERARVEKNMDVIDVYFQPGPMHGFRSDELPPDLATRRGMLWRVCAGITRLLPSVRNVEILAERKAIGGNVFPDGWREDSPIAHYGAFYQHGGKQIFEASESARAWASKFKNYVTITIRQAPHWSLRNSNLEAWHEVAQWLAEQGIEPIIVPDSGGERLYHWTHCPEASFDVDLRAALYEGALMNLGVANGPMYLLPFLKARYLIFNLNVESVHTSSVQFLKSHGIEQGDELAFGGNGRVVWKPDTAADIIAELGEFEFKQERKTL